MAGSAWEKNSSEEAIRLRKKALSIIEQEDADNDAFNEAIDLIEKAADLGDAEAQSNFADFFRVNDDHETALYWCRKAAEQGYPAAQNNTAYHYQRGLGAPADPKQQFYWYKKAAENGFTDSKNSLAVCYLNGIGTSQNIPEAIGWLKQAADDGHTGAKTRLGAAYVGGMGVEADKEKGWRLIQEAADAGDAKAKELIRNEKGGGAGGSGGGSKGGCYIATCVYGSYDCPEVRTLRLYRDNRLSNSWLGRRFIQVYYAVSPTIVKLFGNTKWFNGLCKPVINEIVRKLRDK